MSKHNLPVIIRPITPDDFAHIVVTWCKSYKTSDFSEEIKFETYMDHHKELVQKTIETAQGSVLCLDSDKSLIISYCIFDQIRDELVIHYVHTKPRFRKFGFATQLIDSIVHSNFTITHKTKMTKYIKQTNYNYNPYLFFEERSNDI